MLSEVKQKRLNLLRYGLMVVTAVAFALGTSLVYIGSGRMLKALSQGVLLAVGAAVLCTIIYYLYGSYLRKSV